MRVIFFTSGSGSTAYYVSKKINDEFRSNQIVKRLGNLKLQNWNIIKVKFKTFLKLGKQFENGRNSSFNQSWDFKSLNPSKTRTRVQIEPKSGLVLIRPMRHSGLRKLSLCSRQIADRSAVQARKFKLRKFELYIDTLYS